MAGNELGSKKYKRMVQGFIFPVILIVISTIVIAAGIVPGFRTISETLTKSSMLEKENEDINKRLKVLASLDEDTLRSHVSLLLSAVPSEKAIGNFLTTFQELCVRSQIELTDFSLDKPGDISSDSAALASASIASRDSVVAYINLTGTKDQLKNLLDQMISVRRLMIPTELNVQLIENDMLNAKLTVRTFYAALPKNLGKITDPLTVLSEKEETLLAKLNSYPYINSLQLSPEIQYFTKPDPFSRSPQ